jgi:hypothetical protein
MSGAVNPQVTGHLKCELHFVKSLLNSLFCGVYFYKSNWQKKLTSGRGKVRLFVKSFDMSLDREYFCPFISPTSRFNEDGCIETFQMSMYWSRNIK